MPLFSRLLLLLLLSTSLSTGTRAQSVSVTLTGFEQPVLTRPFVSDLEQRFTTGVHQMLVTIEGIQEAEYRFRYVLRRGNEQIASITSQPIRLEEGVHIFQFTENAGSGPDISFSQTQEQFINSLSGQLPRQIFTTGRLPDGRYRFTVDVELVNPSAAPGAILLGGEVVMEVRYPEPPRLSQPLEGEIVATENPVFSWDAPINVTPGALISYTLRIVPIPEGASAVEAMRQGLNGIEIANLTSTSYTYVDTPLEPGVRYGWQVQQTVDLSGAGDVLPESELQNGGRSPIQFFFVLGNVARTSAFLWERTLSHRLGGLSITLPANTFDPDGDQTVVPTESSYSATFQGQPVSVSFSPGARLSRTGQSTGTATVGPLVAHVQFDEANNRPTSLLVALNPSNSEMPRATIEIPEATIDLATGEVTVVPGNYPATPNNLKARRGELHVTFTAPALTLSSLSGLLLPDGTPALPYPMPRWVNLPTEGLVGTGGLPFEYVIPSTSISAQGGRVTVNNLPDWLSFNPETLTLRGTRPRKNDINHVTLILTDEIGETATHQLSIQTVFSIGQVEGIAGNPPANPSNTAPIPLSGPLPTPGAPSGPPIIAPSPQLGSPVAPPSLPSPPTGGLPSSGGQGAGSTSTFYQQMPGSTLSARPIPDVQVQPGQTTQITLPPQTFTGPSSTVSIEARQSNGQPLPGWLTFSPSTGTFSARVPPGLRGRISIDVIIRDERGRQATTTFEIQYTSATPPR